ncbi:MAG TPA: serine protease [Solirubrobacterales bacterium]|nr:serine protease [Solirubrobacterales bacterium]
MGDSKRIARTSSRLALLACALVVTAMAASSATGATTAQTSIVNGAPTSIASLPSLAFITHKAPSFVRHGGPPEYTACAGTVVAPQIVLTAGHCVQSFRGGLMSTTGYRVTTGAQKAHGAFEGTVSRVSRVLIIPGYNPGNRRYDVGLLVLSQPVSAPSIRLARPGESGLVADGKRLIVAGWGFPKPPPSQLSPLLRSGATIIGSTGSCQQQGAGAPYGFFPEFQICALPSPEIGNVSCDGDGGGPGLVPRADGALVQVGVISSQGPGCELDKPEVLTRVDSVYGWVTAWIAAYAGRGYVPKVSIPKVTYPQMSEQRFKSLAPQVLAWNFRKAFTGRRGPLTVNRCKQLGKIAIKCRVGWTYAGMPWSGRVSLRYATTREGLIINLGYRIKHVNKTCFKKYRGTRRCVVIVRGH